jgi:hypothetical protein
VRPAGGTLVPPASHGSVRSETVSPLARGGARDDRGKPFAEEGAVNLLAAFRHAGRDPPVVEHAELPAARRDPYPRPGDDCV